MVKFFFVTSQSVLVGYKSRLLFAKIAMAIWFQVSGVMKHVQFIIFLGELGWSAV
jgi:hypothetical protein